jgi:hypothetical protein
MYLLLRPALQDGWAFMSCSIADRDIRNMLGDGASEDAIDQAAFATTTVCWTMRADM